MRIGVYLQNEGDIEPQYVELDINSLLSGRSIWEAEFRNILGFRVGITEDNFVRGFVEVEDCETGISLTFTYTDFKEFMRELWFIRQKLRRTR